MMTYHNWNWEGPLTHSALQVRWKWWVSFRYTVWKLTWLREFVVDSFQVFSRSFCFFLRIFCTANIFEGRPQQIPLDQALCACCLQGVVSRLPTRHYQVQTKNRSERRAGVQVSMRGWLLLWCCTLVVTPVLLRVVRLQSHWLRTPRHRQASRTSAAISSPTGSAQQKHPIERCHSTRQTS